MSAQMSAASNAGSINRGMSRIGATSMSKTNRKPITEKDMDLFVSTGKIPGGGGSQETPKTANTAVVYVTPEMAREWLAKHNTCNRAIRRATVDRIAHALRTGKFIRGTDPIMFAATDGRLVNGQHRLTAIVETGIGAWVEIRREVTEEQVALIDTVGARSAGDVGKITGKVHKSYVTAPRINALALLLGVSNRPLRFDEQAPIYAAMKGALDWAADNAPTSYKLGEAPVGAALAYLYYRQPEQTKRFNAALKELTGLPKGSPVLAISRYLHSDHGDDGVTVTKKVIYCFVAYLKGETVARVKTYDDALVTPSLASKLGL